MGAEMAEEVGGGVGGEGGGGEGWGRLRMEMLKGNMVEEGRGDGGS